MAKPTRAMTNITPVEPQQPEGCQWLHRLINRRSYRISVFIIVCVLNIVDLLVDWYFFMSKVTIQKGLVFGPPPRNILLAIFSFCIISTFTSFLEIVQISRDTYQNRMTSLFGQITNSLTIWLEDVPLLTLNLLLVICRDGEVTYISLAKAIIGIVAACIRFLSILLNKWLIRHDYQRKDHLSRFFNTISTLGIVLVSMLSISIHIIASLPIDHYGHVHLEKPSDFQHFRFAHKKYFHPVGLFLHSSNVMDKYIYLTGIESIIDKGPKQFIYGYHEKENVFCLKETNQTCYRLLNDSSLELYDKPLTTKLINYSINFQFQQPDFYYLLGDIHYNIMRCDLKGFYIDDRKWSFHYFRFNENFNGTKLPLHFDERSNAYRYYDQSNDFQSIEHLWQTGLSRCSSTSSFTPHRSHDVRMNDCF